MSNHPPSQSSYAYPPPRTSGLAVTSLVTGILGCMIVTALAAIITGALGIRATRDPAVRGRGMAIAGIVLGVVWLVIAAAGGAGIGVFLKNSEAPAVVARQFTADVVAGNYPAALAASKGLTEEQLRGLHDAIEPWGANTDITLNNRHAKAQGGGVTRWELTGTATFATAGTKAVEYVVVTKPNGGYEVIGIDFK